MSFHLVAPTTLVLDLLDWVATRTRTYRETMEAWRTSCPRLPAWEDALENRFVEVVRKEGDDELTVVVTAEGWAFLKGRSTEAKTTEGRRRLA
jgi:hypothetical protein